MKQTTVIALNQLNHQFYQTSAQDFSTTRKTAWNGWEKLRSKLEKLSSNQNQFKVLDVGCGNGRLAQFLATVWPNQAFKYTGLDLSSSLLAVAETSLSQLPQLEVNLVKFDLVQSWLNSDQLNQSPWQERFNLIGLFGVLHHLPALDLRRFWLKQLINSLEPEGLLILTYWRFDREQARFNRKVIAPKIVGLNAKELESGDLILDWRRGGLNYRYCHLASDSEIQANSDWLLENLPEISLETSFEADGKSDLLNHYQVWRKNT